MWDYYRISEVWWEWDGERIVHAVAVWTLHFRGCVFFNCLIDLPLDQTEVESFGSGLQCCVKDLSKVCYISPAWSVHW